MAKLQRPTARPADHPAQAEARRTTFLEAVAIYEQGVQQLQQHDFVGAAERLRRIVTAFPQERELCERARLYLALCDRQLQPAAAEPQSLQEHIYAATLALNAGEVDRAIGHLNAVLQQDPGNDTALYLLASAHAQRGNLEVAIPYLQQAIASNPDNRVLARSDPDLEGLRAEDTIAALLDSPLLQPASDPKRSTRTRAR